VYFDRNEIVQIPGKLYDTALSEHRDERWIFCVGKLITFHSFISIQP